MIYFVHFVVSSKNIVIFDYYADKLVAVDP